MFKTITCITTLAFALLVAAPAYATEPAAEAPPAAPAKKTTLEPRIAPLMKGQCADFTGLLVPEKRYTEFLDAEVTARDLRGKLDIEAKKHDALESMYQEKLKQASEPLPWYKEPSFNRWLGLGIGVVVTSLAIWGGSELAKAGR
jgi:hypothetical protein